MRRDTNLINCENESPDIVPDYFENLLYFSSLIKDLHRLKSHLKLPDNFLDDTEALIESIKHFEHVDFTLFKPLKFFAKYSERLQSLFSKARALSIELSGSEDSLFSICEGIVKYMPQLEILSIHKWKSNGNHLDEHVLESIPKLQNLKVLDLSLMNHENLSYINFKLGYLSTMPLLEKLILNRHELDWDNELHNEELETLINKGVEVHLSDRFGSRSIRDLVKGNPPFNRSGVFDDWHPSFLKHWPYYLNEMKWLEKIHFKHASASFTREELIERVKSHLTQNQVDFTDWETFIESAEKFQLLGLLQKDAYYLGKLDDDARIYQWESLDKNSLPCPSKVKQLRGAGKKFIKKAYKDFMCCRSLVIEGKVDYELHHLIIYIHLEDLQFPSYFYGKEIPILPKLKSLSFCKGCLYTSDMRRISQMPKLEKLKFGKIHLNNISDLNFLEHLKSLKELEVPEEWEREEILGRLSNRGVKVYCGAELKHLGGLDKGNEIMANCFLDDGYEGHDGYKDKMPSCLIS